MRHAFSAVRALAPRARRCTAAVAAVVAIGAAAACSAPDDDPETGDAAAETSAPPSPSPSPEPSLSAAEAQDLAEAAMLSPDSALLEGYTVAVAPQPNQRDEYTPLYECKQEALVEGRLNAYVQIYDDVRPKTEIFAHAYEGEAVEVLAQLREAWDSECLLYEVDDDGFVYTVEREAEVPAPDGVAAESWAGDCARVTVVEDGNDALTLCRALVAVGEHVILDVTLSGPWTEAEQYQERLGAIALEVLAAQ